MAEQPTGIAGAADQTRSGGITCHACGAGIDVPHALRALPGVGAVAACSAVCARALGRSRKRKEAVHG